MTEHAKFAPSAAHRWIECPASIRLSEGIEYEPSGYAMTGTILHQIIEQCLREKIPPETFLGALKEFKEGDSTFQLNITDDDVKAIQACIDEVKSIMIDYKIKSGKLEVRVDIGPDLFGTVDVLLWNAERIIVIDFKFGSGVSVEAEGNSQQMLYTIGAINYLKNSSVKPPSKALLVILQPFIPPIRRTWEVEIGELYTWYDKSVKPAVEEAKNGDAVCNPGEQQCRFCPANGVCTARAEYLLGIASSKFKQFSVSEQETLPAVQPAITVPSTDLLTPEIAGRILDVESQFDNFFKAVREWAVKEKMAGRDIPGWKLVEGRSNRKWIDPDAIELHLTSNYRDEEVFIRKLVSPAQAEKKWGRGTFDQYITKPKGKPSLVPATDTRPEMNETTVASMEKFVETEAVTGNSDVINIDKDEDTKDLSDMASELFDDGTIAAPNKHITLLTSDRAVSPPNTNTKKHQVLMRGLKGGDSISKVTDEIFSGTKGNFMGALRNLNERHGYVVQIDEANDKFLIREEI